MKEKFGEFFSSDLYQQFFPKDNSSNLQLKAVLFSHRSNVLQVTDLDHTKISSPIMMSNISDHFPCRVKLEILEDKPKWPKYIHRRSPGYDGI